MSSITIFSARWLLQSCILVCAIVYGICQITFLALRSSKLSQQISQFIIFFICGNAICTYVMYLLSYTFLVRSVPCWWSCNDMGWWNCITWNPSHFRITARYFDNLFYLINGMSFHIGFVWLSERMLVTRVYGTEKLTALKSSSFDFSIVVYQLVMW